MNSPSLFLSDGWKDYELIDSGDGKRLERWNDIILVRPDPQALWPASRHRLWGSPDAAYHRSATGGGRWEEFRSIPEEWTVGYNGLVFKVRPTGFKHTGLFPEQAHNWDRIEAAVARRKRLEMLNLFGYTGAASVAAAKAGAKVCHVDASKGMLTWCAENAALSGVNADRIRLIPDDCLKFTAREARRGNKYDAIVMDPPSFGRGGKGEVWKLEDDFWKLLCVCREILSDEPAFILINSYTAGISSVVAANMLESLDLPPHSLEYGELGLPFREGKMALPCGITVWAGF